MNHRNLFIGIHLIIIWMVWKTQFLYRIFSFDFYTLCSLYVMIGLCWNHQKHTKSWAQKSFEAIRCTDSSCIHDKVGINVLDVYICGISIILVILQESFYHFYLEFTTTCWCQNSNCFKLGPNAYLLTNDGWMKCDNAVFFSCTWQEHVHVGIIIF